MRILLVFLPLLCGFSLTAQFNSAQFDMGLNTMRYLLPFYLLLFLLSSCGHRLDAINWYLRIEHTEACQDYGLYGGDFQVLCPVDDAVWNGDTLIVKSAEVCYFIKANDYKDNQPLDKINCSDFHNFIQIGPSYWAQGEGPRLE